jgi:hypothetical protein
MGMEKQKDTDAVIFQVSDEVMQAVNRFMAHVGVMPFSRGVELMQDLVEAMTKDKNMKQFPELLGFIMLQIEEELPAIVGTKLINPEYDYSSARGYDHHAPKMRDALGMKLEQLEEGDELADVYFKYVEDNSGPRSRCSPS